MTVMRVLNVRDAQPATRITAFLAGTFTTSAMRRARVSTFLAGFRRLRQASAAALGAADADSARRSVTMVEVHLDELRCLYDLLPDDLRANAWMLISVERAA